MLGGRLVTKLSAAATMPLLTSMPTAIPAPISLAAIVFPLPATGAGKAKSPETTALGGLVARVEALKRWVLLVEVPVEVRTPTTKFTPLEYDCLPPTKLGGPTESAMVILVIRVREGGEIVKAA